MSEYHQIEASSEVLANWEDVFAKSRKVEATSTTGDDSDKSLIMAAHKIIPAHVSSMVPFGKLFGFDPSANLNDQLFILHLRDS